MTVNRLFLTQELLLRGNGWSRSSFLSANSSRITISPSKTWWLCMKKTTGYLIKMEIIYWIAKSSNSWSDRGPKVGSISMALVVFKTKPKIIMARLNLHRTTLTNYLRISALAITTMVTGSSLMNSMRFWKELVNGTSIGTWSSLKRNSWGRTKKWRGRTKKIRLK